MEGHTKTDTIESKATILVNSLLEKVTTNDLVQIKDITPLGKCTKNIEAYQLHH